MSSMRMLRWALAVSVCVHLVLLLAGRGYWSAWLARMGARPVGIDNSERQLETARALQREHGLEFPLIHGNAEEVPFPDASFDLALSEYGASIWCDPERWIPEAARLLRPGGRLIFLVNSVLAMLCFPEEGELTEQLQRPLAFERSAANVVERVRTERPAIVIFDLNSQKLRPFEAISAIKSDPELKTTRTLGYVSHVDAAAIASARAAGVDEVLARSAFTERLGDILSSAS